MSVNTVKQDGSLQRIAGGTLYADAPIGTISPFGGSAIPSGYLLCNGQAVSRTNYKELFAVIGTAFGSGDGSTTFNVPDMRESVPKGAGLTSKSNNHMDADGLAVGEFLDDRVQNITGRISRSGAIGAGGAFYGGGSNYNANLLSGSIDGSKHETYFDASRIVRAGNTTEVKSVGVNYIIKAKQVAVPADFMDAINDVLKVSEPVSARNTKYITNGNIMWKRSGNVVEVTFFNVALASQTSGDVTLATGLPPSKNYSWSVINSLTNANVQQGVAVNTNGNLTSIGGSTGGSSYYDSFTYLAAD